MTDLEDEVDRVAAESGFSGVVRVDGSAGTELAKAYGYAHRGLRVANTVETCLGLASGGKGLTALAVMSLVEEGRLALATTARSVLGDDLPLIGDDVTVEHLLAHRSGIGEYLDDDADVTDYLLPLPVHELGTTEGFLGVLDGHPTMFPAGERFAYCNGGYMVLALIAERVSGTPFHELVGMRVCEPAGMANTAFLRSDEPADGVALGYLESGGLRTNVLHLPVRGNGDGGVYSTVGDVHLLWSAFLGGRIVPADRVAAMVRPRSDANDGPERYGLGFWLHASGDAVMLEGLDAGVSFRSVHDPTRGITSTVISNWTDGAWPLARHLDHTLRS
jgi:CubicO group peptidase (beta-lactamase class C family)